MSDEKTKVVDVIVPEVFEQYAIERTAELSTFFQSGIVARDREFDALASGPGTTVQMPFWRDISGDRQILSDTTAIETRKIGTSKDVARIHNDANSWSVTLLSELLAGADGMAAIINLVGSYWAREDESMLVASINGVLAELDSEAGDPNLLKIASESISATDADSALNGTTFVDATQKLGDRKDRLVAVAMHSAVESDLKKLDLIDFVPDSEGKNMIKTFQGLRVIMDDNLPSRAGTSDGTVYTTILFGDGAFASGNAPLTQPIRGGFGTEAVEFARVALNSDDVMINRRRHILHPRGVAWLEADVAGDGGPTNVELAAAANWNLVYEAKNVRIVGVTHNLNSQIGAAS